MEKPETSDSQRHSVASTASFVNRAGEGRPTLLPTSQPAVPEIASDPSDANPSSLSDQGEERPLMFRANTEPLAPRPVSTDPAIGMDHNAGYHNSVPPSLPPPARRRTFDTPRSRGASPAGKTRESVVDWIVPEKNLREERMMRTVGERLQPTIDTAESERAKYSRKALITGYSLNIAIGLQVLLGALTTGLSASLSGNQIGKVVASLGGISTLVASYLARARGSNEPELSIARVKDLDQFLREARAFSMDFGHEVGDKYDPQLTTFRSRFEELLGNGNGERRLSSPV